MPKMNRTYIKARKEIWGMIQDCKECKQSECPEWCREFVRCQMDDLIEKLLAMSRCN